MRSPRIAAIPGWPIEAGWAANPGAGARHPAIAAPGQTDFRFQGVGWACALPTNSIPAPKRYTGPRGVMGLRLAGWAP